MFSLDNHDHQQYIPQCCLGYQQASSLTCTDDEWKDVVLNPYCRGNGLYSCQLHPYQDTAPGEYPSWTQHRSVDDHLHLEDDEEVRFTIEVKEEINEVVQGMRFGIGKWNGIGEYISVTIIVHNVARSLAPRNIVKICFLPFIEN